MIRGRSRPLPAISSKVTVVKAGYYAASSNNYGRTYDIR